MWVEILHPTRIDGVLRHAGWREDLAARRARALLGDGQARRVDGPHEERDGPGYRIDETPLDELEFSELDGISEAYADDIHEAADVETAEALLDTELTQLPHVGDALADDLRDYLERVT